MNVIYEQLNRQTNSIIKFRIVQNIQRQKHCLQTRIIDNFTHS